MRKNDREGRLEAQKSDNVTDNGAALPANTTHGILEAAHVLC